MYRTVCCVIPSPILLVRTSFHTVFSCDNNSVFITLHSEHQQLFWWHVSNKAPSAASMYTAVYSYMCRVFLGGLGCFPLLYVLTSCVSRHPVSYIVSASFVYRVSREHSTAAVGFHFGVHRTILSLLARRPHSENESSPFFGMYQKQHHQQQE